MSDDDEKDTVANSDGTPKAPIKLNVTTEGAQHKVEKMADGRFMAYWKGRVVYENGANSPLMSELADPVLKASAPPALFRDLVAQDHRDALSEDKARGD